MMIAIQSINQFLYKSIDRLLNERHVAQTSALLAYLEHPCLMPAGFQRSSATERQPKRQRATEQPSLVNMPLHWTDEFWLEEAKDFTSQDASLAGGHHPRRPDLAMKICIYMKTKSAWAWQVCSGVYLGHGQSKTAFRLIGQASLTNAVLKVARKKDMEPEVFSAASNYGVCPPILHNGWGTQASSWCSTENIIVGLQNAQYHWMNVYNVRWRTGANVPWLLSSVCWNVLP